MKIAEIREIIDLMATHGLNEFEMEENGARITIKRGGTTQVVQTVVAPAPVAAAPAPAPVAAAAAPAAPVDDPRMTMVKAPFVGTFYRASSPDAPPYVTVGTEVGPDTVLCIVEAMKVMNEIKSEVRGIVREVLVENTHAVQYGQPLFKIEKT